MTLRELVIYILKKKIYKTFKEGTKQKNIKKKSGKGETKTRKKF